MATCSATIQLETMANKLQVTWNQDLIEQYGSESLIEVETFVNETLGQELSASINLLKLSIENIPVEVNISVNIHVLRQERTAGWEKILIKKETLSALPYCKFLFNHNPF